MFPALKDSAGCNGFNLCLHVSDTIEIERAALVIIQILHAVRCPYILTNILFSKKSKLDILQFLCERYIPFPRDFSNI